jgi:hypothetical protein
MSTGARQRAGALMECLALVALMNGARRGESWRSLGLARPPHLGRADGLVDSVGLTMLRLGVSRQG